MSQFFRLVLALCFSLVSVSYALAAFTSTSFELENPVIILEGGNASSTSFQYISSTGQLTSGQLTSTSFGHDVGSLYFPQIVASPPSGGGGGGGGGYVGVPYITIGPIPGLSLDCRIADFNCDKSVNIFDLSILLYYAEKSKGNPDIITPYDLSKDEKIDLADVSIVFYYWDK